MILRKIIHTKHCDFVVRSKCYYYNTDEAKKPRKVRMFKTGESKQQRNKRNSYLNNKYLLYNNFDIGDWWITLTHGTDVTADEADNILTDVFSRVRKKLTREGIPFRYFSKTEAGNRIKPHHHAFINAPADKKYYIRDLIEEYWEKYGQIKKSKKIYNIADGKLVEYFLDGGDHKQLNYTKYHHSRNLVKPETEKKLYQAKQFRETPKPPQEDKTYRYEIHNLFNGFPDKDGYIYQSYEIHKIRKETEQVIKEEHREVDGTILEGKPTIRRNIAHKFVNDYEFEL